VVGVNPQEVLVGTTNVFVGNADDGTVSVVNQSSRAVTTTITVGEQPFGMNFYYLGGSATETHLLVCNRRGNSVSIIDLSNNTIVGTYQ